MLLHRATILPTINRLVSLIIFIWPIVRQDKIPFVIVRQLFDDIFSPAGCLPSMVGFLITERTWPVATKKLCSPCGCPLYCLPMLSPTPAHIVSDARIKAIVGSKNNINTPIICLSNSAYTIDCHDHFSTAAKRTFLASLIFAAR